MALLVRVVRHAACAILSLVAACGGPVDPPRQLAPPRVAGLDADGLSAAVRGQALLGELGCVACHDAGDRGIEAAAGPDLRTAGARIDARHLHGFVLSPHDQEPGTVMPDLLRRWRGAELVARAEALAHFVRSLAGADASADATKDAHDAAAAARGAALFGRIGCRACHDGATALPPLAGKYPLAALQAFLLAPHEARPSRRMPDFGLSAGDALDLAHHLRGASTATSTAPSPIAAVDPQQAAQGRTWFAELRCASCHPLGDAIALPAPPPSPPALVALDPARGCLSGTVGPWPHYALDDGQRADLRAGIAAAVAPAGPQDNAHRVHVLLAQRRCVACHRRDGIDGLSQRSRDLFGTDDASLGEEARMPPSLDGVGARLQRKWLGRAIAHGQRERPYLHARMPGFGEAFADRLASALAATDTLPPIAVAPLPDDHDAARRVIDLGAELVGDKGMNCIACHRFAGEQAGAMGAIDLVHTTGERLRPEWFAHFLRDPFRFKPNTIMPHYFPDGRSTRPQFADGDVARQIDAMWHYLAEGRNVRQPSGLRRPPIELVVGDDAVLLRRAVQGVGKRGIAVGLPGGVNAAFDAEDLALVEVWWGRFVDARPVWTSQGSGEARVLGEAVAKLPDGPALAVLSAPDAPWPLATRRERGDRWLGYDLDDRRRPTFRYTAGDVGVADAWREVAQPDGARLQRTLTLTGAAGFVDLRAAAHERIEPLDARTVRVGDALAIDCGDAPWTIVAGVGAAKELRVRLATAPAGAAHTIGYRRLEGGK